MKKTIIFSLLFSMIISCSKEQAIDFKIPENYKSWKKPINEVLTYEVPGHGNGPRIIYANDIAYSAKMTKDKKGYKQIIMPDGAIIIKEIYNKKKDINKKDPMLTIMVKDSKNSNAMSGWLNYVKKPGKGQKLIVGKMCIGCHEAANYEHPYFDKNKKGIFRDFLYVQFIK